MSELTAQAIEKIANLALEPKRLHVVQIPEKNRYALFNATTGTLEYVDMEAPSRAHTVSSIEAAIGEARRLKAAKLSPVVWVNYGSVVILDDADRRDKSSLVFEKTSQFELLEGLQIRSAGIPQKAFIRMLRVDLDGCLGTTGNFLSLVRQLKFTAGQDATGTIQHGKESISRSTIAELVGADAIPEEVTLAVRVYDLPAEAARAVRCAVDIDVQTQTFMLTPFPSELVNAERSAITAILEHIETELEGDKIPVVFGTP